MDEEMAAVAPLGETKSETQEAPLPPYDSLPPPPYAFNCVPPYPSPGHGGYYLQQYPPMGYEQAPTPSHHIYQPGVYYQNHHHQQSGLVMVTEAPVVHYKPAQTFYAHIALACLVTWICNPLFGFMAVVLAMLAQSAAAKGKDEDARRLGQASLGLSVAGIIILVVLVITFIVIAIA